jgi:hypothetical protein
MSISMTVTGDDRLLAALHTVDTEQGLQATIRPAHAEVGRLVETTARGLASGRQMARAVRSNVTRTVAAGVEVVIGGGGGDRAWAVGAQYGAVVYPQFPGPAGPDGYTVVPAAKDRAPQIGELWADRIVDRFD